MHMKRTSYKVHDALKVNDGWGVKSLPYRATRGERPSRQRRIARGPSPRRGMTRQLLSREQISALEQTWARFVARLSGHSPALARRLGEKRLDGEVR